MRPSAGTVERGRARASVTRGSPVAYFEWSALPGSDPADPATWWACMPALGRTITEATIAAEFERLDLADFCRAYLNWWPSEIPADWLVISEADWRALADPDSAAVDPVAFAADVTPDRSHAAIGVAGIRPDGLEVLKPTTRARAAADSGLYDAVAEQRLRYVPRPALDAAVAGAATRPLGDSWAWARKGLSVDICPLVAVSLARWGHATRAHKHNPGLSVYF